MTEDPGPYQIWTVRKPDERPVSLARARNAQDAIEMAAMLLRAADIDLPITGEIADLGPIPESYSEGLKAGLANEAERQYFLSQRLAQGGPKSDVTLALIGYPALLVGG